MISKQCQKKTGIEYRFVKLSATMSGVNDVKEAVKIAKNEVNSFKRRTILFMDEIHRFNKLQQVCIPMFIQSHFMPFLFMLVLYIHTLMFLVWKSISKTSNFA